MFIGFCFALTLCFSGIAFLMALGLSKTSEQKIQKLAETFVKDKSERNGEIAQLTATVAKISEVIAAQQKAITAYQKIVGELAEHANAVNDLFHNLRVRVEKIEDVERERCSTLN